jgi:hypothetical protein
MSRWVFLITPKLLLRDCRKPRGEKTISSLTGLGFRQRGNFDSRRFQNLARSSLEVRLPRLETRVGMR